MPKYLPSLSTLISLDKLPLNLGFLQGVVNTLFDDIYYDHYHVVVSPNGDSKTFNLDIVLKKPVGFTIPGADISFLINPNDDNNNPQSTSFNVTLFYRLGILKFINSFNLSSFTFSKDDFLELLRKAFDLSESTIIESISEHIKNPDGVALGFLVFSEAELVDFFNDYYELTGTVNELIYTATTTFQDIANALNVAGVPISEIIDAFGIDTDYPGGNDTLQDVFSRLNIIRDSGPLGISELIEELNTQYNLSGTLNEIIYVATPETTYEDILSSLTTANLGVVNLILDYIIPDNLSVKQIENTLTNFFIRAKQTAYSQNYKDLFIPQIRTSINNLNFAIEFPRNYLIPIDTDPNSPTFDKLIDDETIKSRVKFKFGKIGFNTEDGMFFENESDISFKKSEIGKTGIRIEFSGMKLDLSRTTNIPEATADGRPEDFIGVYVTEATITLPQKWFSNPGSGEALPEGFTATPTTPSIKGTNLLIGTGGISGKIAFLGNGSLYKKIGKFWIGLDSFSITFHQNAITSSDIKGRLLLPDFKNSEGHPVIIDISIHIGTGGEFELVASTSPSLTAFTLPKVFNFNVSELFIKRQSDIEGGLWYIGVVGEIDFTAQKELGKFLPDKIDIKKMLIYENGKFEFEGGKVVLPKAYEFTIGVAKIGITAINLGSYEKDGRQYKYFGFDGGVSTNPNSVSAQGKGINFYFTVDGPYTSAKEFKWFIKIESIAIDITIPADTEPEDAALIIKGYLAMREPQLPKPPGPNEPPWTQAQLDEIEVLKNSTEYAGGVYVSIPKLKGLEASASMRLNPQVPAFLVDIALEFSTGWPLGSTGISLYGFRVLFGKNYIATLKAAGDNVENWWQYYKAKIAPDYKEGVQVSKFINQKGFSFGAGVSLATTAGAGKKVLTAKVFLYLGLPVFTLLIQGQAAVLRKRIGLDDTPDPPFSFFTSITKTSIEMGMKVFYNIPDEGARIGKVLALDAQIEMGFFFENSSAWYVNIGTQSNPNRAKVFDIFDLDSYVMISNSGIRAGAGARYNVTKSYKVISGSLSAFIQANGSIAFRPSSIAGSVQLGGNVSIKCCGIGFGVSGSATLAAEAAKPKTVSGQFEVCVKVLRKEYCLDFDFIWKDSLNQKPDESQNPVLIDVPADQTDVDLNNPISLAYALADAKKVARATHMVTGDTYPVAVKFCKPDSIPLPNEWITKNGTTIIDDYRIPMDSFIDIEFKTGMNVANNAATKIGDLSTPCQFEEYIPPVPSGINPQVKHTYTFEQIEIKYFDEISNTWENYDFFKSYKRMLEQLPPDEKGIAPATDPEILKKMKWGYWQLQRPGHNTKLRILANNSLSYLAKAGNHITPEDMGISKKDILCPPPDKIPLTCVLFDNNVINKVYIADEIHVYKKIQFKLISNAGTVLAVSYNTIPNGLNIQAGDTLEITFLEAMHTVNLLLKSTTPKVTIGYYSRHYIDPVNAKELPTYEYQLIKSIEPTLAELNSIIEFNADDSNIHHVRITTLPCNVNNSLLSASPYAGIQCMTNDTTQQATLTQLRIFLAKLIEKKHFALATLQLNPLNASIYTGIYMGTHLYPKQNWNDKEITLLQGYISTTQLLFTIADQSGYTCNFSFEVQPTTPPLEGFSFDKLISITDLQPLTENAEIGANYGFIMECMFKPTPNAVPKKVIIKGKSCIATTQCFDTCSSFLYQVCYLSADDNARNKTIPSKKERQEENKIRTDGINKSLNIIWAPNTSYAIYIRTTDKINTKTDPYKTELVFGFRTEGPIGFYHKYPKEEADTVTAARADYKTLEDIGRDEEFKLNSLKYYIDFDHSYPNAAGILQGAKPLFYKNIKLQLFYLYNHVYEFYNNWEDEYAPPITDKKRYIAKCSLEMKIKDPLDTGLAEATINYTKDPNLAIINLPAIFGTTAGNLSGLTDNIRSHNNDITILNNMLENSLSDPADSDCLPFPDKLKPIQISTERNVCLRPEKLYTAQYIAHYNPRKDTSTNSADDFRSKSFEEVVHSYGFQTSRYANFEEQINSYILKRNEEDKIVKAAIFNLDANAVEGSTTPTPNLLLARRVILDTLEPTEADDKIHIQYADPFERLITGVFHIDPNDLQAPVTTEFNIVKAPNDPEVPNRILGVLICNPEPFNNPQLPEGELKKTLYVNEVDNDGAIVELSKFKIIFSKDKRKMFVTNEVSPTVIGFNIPSTTILRFLFSYLLYNGKGYVVPEDQQPITVNIELSKYFI